MDKGSQFRMSIERMPQGGYLVFPAFGPHDYHSPLFAASTVDEALKFVRDMLLPVGGPMPPPDDDGGSDE